nr:MAG TPA: hypothetical protein [Crassvirales sp.]
MDMYQNQKQHFHLNLEKMITTNLGLIVKLLAAHFKKLLLIVVVL